MRAETRGIFVLAVSSMAWMACGGAPTPMGTTTSALSPNSAVGVITNFGPNLQTAANGACRQPEGLTTDPDGNIWITSNSDSATTVGHVCKLSPDGALLEVIDVPSGPVNLIGLLGAIWEHGKLYFLDQGDNSPGSGRFLSADPQTRVVTVLDSSMQFPNGLVEDQYRHIYVTDSLVGAIYRFNDDGSGKQTWIQDPSLTTNNPNLPVGVNGIALDRDGDRVIVANTGNRQLLTIPVNRDGSAGAISVLADGATLDQNLGLPSPTALFGADGLQIDTRGNVVVACNHANEIQYYSRQGELLQRYAGTGANALDFSASVWFKGDDLYITNSSAFDGGGNSKVSRMEAPFRGLRMH